jgi:hypothetical protein
MGSKTLEGSATAGRKPDRRKREDRRRHPRYYVSMLIRMRVEGAIEFEPTMLTDISLSGCYVECNSPLVEGTRVELELGPEDLRFHAHAFVRVKYASLGMGLQFVDLDEDASARLHYLIGHLESTRYSNQMAPMLESEDRSAASVGSLAWLPGRESFNAELLLDLAIQFFERKSMLTRDEFLVLLLRSKAKAASRAAEAEH